MWTKISKALPDTDKWIFIKYRSNKSINEKTYHMFDFETIFIDRIILNDYDIKPLVMGNNMLFIKEKNKNNYDKIILEWRYI